MAFGNFNNSNSNNGDKEYRPSVFSALPFSNPNASVGDGSRLSISYWKGMMKVHVQPKTGSDGNFTKYDDKNGNYAFLTPAKAKALADGISKLRDGKLEAVAVLTTNDTKIVNITTANKVGGTSSNYVLYVGNCDTSGITDASIYEFSSDFHNIVENFDMNTNSFERKTLGSEFELDMFQSNLVQFADATNNAIAASVVDAMYFSSNKHTYETLNAIASKMGLSTGGKAVKSNGSFFSNNSGNTSSNNDSERASSRPQEVDSVDSFLNDVLGDEEVPF